jgi:hypothetical protein
MPGGFRTNVHTPPNARRIPAALAMLFLLAPALVALSPQALAGPMTSYSSLPSEHDDLGRSNEPDHFATGVLGPIVTNCVIIMGGSTCTPDPLLPPPGPNQAEVLAPGCTDDTGRQPSGLCGLWSIGGPFGLPPPGTAGIAGPSGNAAPGRFTPTKSTQIVFLDAQMPRMTGPFGSYWELNNKLADLGVFGLLALVTPHAGPFVHLETGVFAWHGAWQDKNGNGVIDHLTDPSGGPAYPENEFVWYGGCTDRSEAYNPSAVSGGFCARPWGASPTLRGWAFPGGHNAFALPDKAGLAFPCLFPVLHALVPQCYVWSPPSSPGSMQGDWLFEYQYDLRPDWTFADQTGEPDPTHRGWHQTPEYPVWFYDQSLFNSLTTVVALDPPAGSGTGAPGGYRPQDARSRDADHYRTWNPFAEDLLRNAIKPAFRSGWQGVCGVLHPPLAVNCAP